MNITRRHFFQFFSKKTELQRAQTPIAQPALSFRTLSVEPLIGEVMIVGFNFAPSGWAFCSGQLLSIAQNTALFSILGTTYGGDGRTTFGLPNLNGCAAMGDGNGPGLTPRTLGEFGGATTRTLTSSQLPAQIIANEIMVRGTGGTQGIGLAKGAEAGAATLTGSSTQTAIDNISPYLAMYYVIALQGIYPARS